MVLSQVFSAVRGGFFISLIILSVLVTVISLMFPDTPVYWLSLNLIGLLFGMGLWILQPVGFLSAAFWDFVTLGQTSVTARFDLVEWIGLLAAAVLSLISIFGLGIESFFNVGEAFVKVFFINPVDFILAYFPIPSGIKAIWYGKTLDFKASLPVEGLKDLIKVSIHASIPGVRDVIGPADEAIPVSFSAQDINLINFKINIWDLITQLVKSVADDIVGVLLISMGIDPSDPGLSFFILMASKFGIFIV